MPQINRIRVNNVKYNFGTQFYDDFVMRFSCKNSIYDLANGGGKSVLMLLLLQNLIPNCTLDDKQPIEKLFRAGSGNTTIHSLIEWKLDSCDVRNGYRYMTTGFCARKAKETGADSEKNTETANIEYFNYCIFYKEFGENDLKNLPLMKGEERVSYSALKAYLRDLEKRDLGVEVKIFDRKGDYQNYISNYGLYESQWEIVRGINKTEGHVRTYFESNYKTTRKVIEDLLIEGIIEKSYNNRIRKDDNDDAMMAQTLLDIRSKLTELARRKEDIANYDNQIMLLDDFSERLLGFKNIYRGKKELEEELLAYLVACKKRLKGEKDKVAAMEAEKAALEDDRKETERKISAAEIEAEYIELGKTEALIEETLLAKEELLKSVHRQKDNLKYIEVASDYEEYLTNHKNYEEIKELIKNSDLGKEEVLTELAGLAAAKEQMVNVKLAELRSKAANASETLEELLGMLEQAKNTEKSCFGQIKKEQGLKEELAKEIKAINERLDVLMTETDLVVAANAVNRVAELEEDILTRKKNIVNLTSLLEKEREKYGDFRQKISETDARLTLTGEEIDRYNEELVRSRQLTDKLDSIKRVYNESNTDYLKDKIENLIHTLSVDIINTESRLNDLSEYTLSIKAGKITVNDKNFEELDRYLKKRYPDVKTGWELLMDMEVSERCEAMKNTPQMPYVIFAGDSYEEISNDKTIYRLNTGAHIIPIVRDEVELAGGVLAYKDMNFIFDEAGVKAEIDRVNEDIGKLEESLRRNRDRYEVMFGDLQEIRNLTDVVNPAEIEERLEKVKADYDRLNREKNTSVESLEVIREKIKSYSESIDEENRTLEKCRVELAGLKKVAELSGELNEKYGREQECEKNITLAMRNHSDAMRKLSHAEEEYETSLRSRNATEELINKIEREFNEMYKPFLDESVRAVSGYSESELDAKAGALRKMLMEQGGELADKERLLKSYELNMKKSLDNLRFHGMTLEEALDAKEKGLLRDAGVEERLSVKRKIEELEAEVAKVDETVNAEQAQKNRIEGSMWHARKLYEEKYGEYVREEITNPTGYILAGRQTLSEITAKILAIVKNVKALEEDNKDILIMEKDLERIVRKAGLEVPENIDASVQEEVVLSAEKYEAAQKQYENLCREEQKKLNIFTEDKMKLADMLNKFNGYELAEEIRRSIVPPENIGDVDNMITGLKETGECIALERDSIEQGIRDMQKIKDSFEERCIQICSNIRTELERLPKLSRITLDDEVISMITLAIPYVKEEMYKDRMSSYINETVSGAETFSSPEEKLKYIKSRLSWKKLFSVIVTDMNSIKLCLYKREHIKDQSRYLRYEEAVGSTGQSQGIYIQFLIAVIHYISNINATGKDTASTGKTIFIDNPFGAAKDVYIWEPIFKLLKTNHVQLVVPARGATPAITKMFDVNYILGQKMAGNRQQTVVVDYRSQVNVEEMEYSLLDYEQATLNLD